MDTQTCTFPALEQMHFVPPPSIEPQHCVTFMLGVRFPALSIVPGTHLVFVCRLSSWHKDRMGCDSSRS